MLSGAAYGTELGSMEDGPGPARTATSCSPSASAAFEDVARFKARVDGAVRQLRGARKAPDTERIYAPGELEFETARATTARACPSTRRPWTTWPPPPAPVASTPPP